MKKSINIKAKYTNSTKYQKHFTLDDRIKIQKIISEHRDNDGKLTIMLKDIGEMLQNDPSTISKEVKLHRVYKARQNYSMPINNNSICTKFENCKKINLCTSMCSRKHCKKCIKCIETCKDYEEYICPNLKRFPWVCNGCPKTLQCHLNKYYYYSDEANKDYKLMLVESREGINLTPHEFTYLNQTITKYVKDGQPIYHIINHEDLPVSERTIYNYFEKNYFDVKNIDLRRKVKFKKRITKRPDKTILRKIKQGRTYKDFQEYMNTHPDASIVEMDTVVSAEGSTKTLLTLHFIKYHFQLAFLMPSKEAIYVNAAINLICDSIGIEMFNQLFEVILTDNGNEFSDPEGIEVEPNTGEIRCKVFFCHPYKSNEKPHCERNHEYIRYILPKGTSFEFLNQGLVNKMMSHINSTIRPSTKGSPYDFMALTYGTELLGKLGIKKIDPKAVQLNKQILK